MNTRLSFTACSHARSGSRRAVLVAAPFVPLPKWRSLCQDPHIGPALVQFEPTALDCMLDACAKFWSAGLERIEKLRVNLFDVNATVLDGLYALRKFDQFAGCSFW